jgi:UDPglucose 6-dehydrogenase
MKIAMVGTGYVGLVTGAGLSETGAHVTCADIDTEKIATLRAGDIPIHEPGLLEMVQRNVQAGRLNFTDDVPAAIRAADVVFIAVGTPPRIDGAADLRALDSVAETVSQHASRELVLVIKSTVPVGTNQRVRRIVAECAHTVHVVSNPEFLKEGAAVQDFLRPDRIVVGCDEQDEFARGAMARLYHPFMLQRHRVIWMDPASAELTKYVANTMLAMRISFMNEVAALCEHVGADVHHVRAGIGSDQRIGSKFLYAGPGYGGSCFPKDVTALVHVAEEHGVTFELASTTHRVNNRQKGILAKKIKRHFDGDLRGKRIGLWGLAFKPRTDDIREGPALTLIDVLISEGAQVVAHDPEAMANVRAQYGDAIELVDNAYDVAEGADALVLITEWRQYQNPDFARLKGLLKQAVLFDGRNIWSEYGLRKQGFVYVGIGVRGS